MLTEIEYFYTSNALEGSNQWSGTLRSWTWASGSSTSSCSWSLPWRSDRDWDLRTVYDWWDLLELRISSDESKGLKAGARTVSLEEIVEKGMELELGVAVTRWAWCKDFMVLTWSMGIFQLRESEVVGGGKENERRECQWDTVRVWITPGQPDAFGLWQITPLNMGRPKSNLKLAMLFLFIIIILSRFNNLNPKYLFFFFFFLDVVRGQTKRVQKYLMTQRSRDP